MLHRIEQSNTATYLHGQEEDVEQDNEIIRAVHLRRFGHFLRHSFKARAHNNQL